MSYCSSTCNIFCRHTLQTRYQLSRKRGAGIQAQQQTISHEEGRYKRAICTDQIVLLTSWFREGGTRPGSIPERDKKFSLLHIIQNGHRAQAASYLTATPLPSG